MRHLIFEEPESLKELLGNPLENGILLFEGSSGKHVAHKAARIVLAGMVHKGNAPREAAGLFHSPIFVTRSGDSEPHLVTSCVTLALDPSGNVSQVKVYRPEWQTTAYKFRELCGQFPNCRGDGLQHPAAAPKVIEMCRTCRGVLGSPRVSQTVSRLNRERGERLRMAREFADRIRAGG